MSYSNLLTFSVAPCNLYTSSLKLDALALRHPNIALDKVSCTNYGKCLQKFGESENFIRRQNFHLNALFPIEMETFVLIK